MGVIPEGCTNTLEVTWGSEVCKQQPAASPAPRNLGTRAPGSLLLERYRPTESVSRHHLFPAGMLCKDKEPLESRVRVGAEASRVRD